MASYTEYRKLDREAIDDAEQDLERDYGVDHALEQFLGEDGVFFDEF